MANSIRFSPAARHLAQSRGLDLSQLQGRGTAKGGVISKGDVLSALKGMGSRPATAPQVQKLSTLSSPAPAVVTPIASSAVNDRYIDIPNSNMRKVIAKRLTESKATVPHYYVTIECEIDELLKLRKMLKKEFDVNVSVNDLVIKSAALALRDVPEANGRWDAKTKSQSLGNGAVDISVAVATPNGLITPIVTEADKRGVQGINNMVKDLAGRAREGKLKPEEYQGGSFTISNLGMFGISSFSAVINPPQACILAVGSGVPRVLPPSSSGSKPRLATTVTVTLSADRRVIDESLASQYLQVFKQYFSSPKTVML